MTPHRGLHWGCLLITTLIRAGPAPSPTPAPGPGACESVDHFDCCLKSAQPHCTNSSTSAAHCKGYSTRQSSGRYGSFSVEFGNGWDSYNIRRLRSFSRNLGSRDVLLLQLSENVPEHVAVPTRVADFVPEEGEEVTIFGYGCTSWRNQRGGGVKRKATFAYGDFSSHLCPGDSGGPFVKGVGGPIFGINSGYNTGNGADIFGMPPNLKVECAPFIHEDIWSSIVWFSD